MYSSLRLALLGAGLLAVQFASAGVPADAPAGTTGLCKDGSYYSGPTKKGACRGHKGVKEWYGVSQGGSAAAPTTDNSAPKSTTDKASTTAGHNSPAAAPSEAAPGGGSGQVWVNRKSKTYHCPGDKWYGKTKNGAYMSEADAKTQGYHADHGKACN